ncbi:MAG: OmpA family protein [Chitinophagaceae bacterium]|nr:OmpA family protein [Chitinophagaceae bacterium]
MKKIKILIALLFVLTSVVQTKAQVAALVTQATNQSHIQITPKIGYDIKPMFDNNTPYINYKGGLGLGLSADYFWRRWGVGADVDYIKNKPQSTFPTAGLKNAAAVSLTSFSLTEQPITRLFYGIGPSYKYQTLTGKLTTELNARIGLASIKGGRVEHRETTTGPQELLNFHAGYNAKNVLSAKAQLKANYFFNNTIGLSFGAYYLYHSKVPELVDPVMGFSAKYAEVNNTIATANTLTGIQNVRTKPCNCGVSSVGVFAGVVFKLAKKAKSKEICLPEYGLAVTAKDKYTGEFLPETEVAVKTNKGEIVQTGITNSFGVVVFEKMMPDDYSIEGTLAKVALDGANATKAEFLNNKNKVVQKEILFSSRHFIIKGKIFECNSNKPIPNITVVLGSTDLSYINTTLSNADGSYMLQIDEVGIFSLYGKKDKYFSQVEEVNASNYNRDKNLFIKLEICAERVECGTAINLKNILFDLDKYVIKEAAKKELNKLVRFMNDNPTVKVELSSHTDCRNTAEYNQTLSQNRANASVDYLVSQGINRDRLIGKGYGESKLLNRCADGVNCSEAEHSINRRTEMKVICPDKN